MVHRIHIPEDVFPGGHWVDIKERRSFKDSNNITSSGATLRPGVTQEMIEEANQQNRAHELMMIDGHGKVATALVISVVAWSKGLIGMHDNLRSWLDSEDCEIEVGDFLADAVEDYYNARKRTKSVDTPPESDSGLDAGVN